jgi:hypothetical protein
MINNLLSQEYIPCEQQLLIELAINSGDFYVMFQRENHCINKIHITNQDV